ncbi:chloride channel protein [Ktedonospora formicarum]|uniref:chloride channel protein n=1 Tax=Ktedonospora formicarum TaxID=2778364 RepID=UPI001F431687|nr:chloride channel protein [Ktedonospora formicarum]
MLTNVWRKSTLSDKESKQANNRQAKEHLSDFTTTPRMLLIALIALCIGVISTFVALLLLKLIGLCTNLFFYLRWNTEIANPAGSPFGLFIIFVPIIGGLIVGLMARYGSSKIRGHGIPEAIESILINGSKVEPKVALLKPISAAISIGSGGPFGAEGPIIMTGGAIGSFIAQFFHFSSSERKTLLVAGAAAGMSATFSAPVAAVLLAVELMLFEWKPRSLIPVALASCTAGILRHYLIGAGPIFPVPAHAAFLDPIGFGGCILLGLLAGLASTVMTLLVYGFEDAFGRLPIHWMWWPAIGGLGIGIGGLIYPRALGVGYDVIGQLLAGDISLQLILGVLLVKVFIWSFSLGSGTSGGVLAPLLMIGCALGAALSHVFPNEGVGFWALIGMGAMLAATMRVPFTSMVFALELTHDFNSFLPLLLGTLAAYSVSVLLMKRSILTEKISRRGYHLSREYATDPLEILFVREVMRTSVVAIPASITRDELHHLLHDGQAPRGIQHLYPIVGEQNNLEGVATRQDLLHLVRDEPDKRQLADFIKASPVVAYEDESLRNVVYRMAETGYTRLPVLKEGRADELAGIVSLQDLLKARSRNLTEERQRERVLHMRLLFPKRARELTKDEAS